MEHLGTVVLETPRLLLRPFREADGETMYRNWASDPLVCRYLTWQPHADAEVSRRLAALWEKEAAENSSVYQWAIVPKETGEPIGSISVVSHDDAHRAAELGYCIGRAWWGQGITAEALREVLRFLIRRVGFLRIAARHDVNNPNSGVVMRKAGMRFEGVLRSSASNSSSPRCDMAVYSILAEELEAPPSPAFRPLARSGQALSGEECLAVLRREKRGVLSVQGDGGYPYALPINYWLDPSDGRLYFHSGPTGHKIDAMLRSEKACFCVTEQAEPDADGWSWYFRSVIVFGRPEILRDRERALDICRSLSYGFTGDRDYIEWEIEHSGSRVLCFSLTPEHISGKRVHEK